MSWEKIYFQYFRYHLLNLDWSVCSGSRSLLGVVVVKIYFCYFFIIIVFSLFSYYFRCYHIFITCQAKYEAMLYFENMRLKQVVHRQLNIYFQLIPNIHNMRITITENRTSIFCIYHNIWDPNSDMIRLVITVGSPSEL